MPIPLVFFSLEKRTIGVALIPNIVFKDKVVNMIMLWTLWGNSTLGLLLHWAHSGKQQPGRGMSWTERITPNAYAGCTVFVR